MTILSYGGGVDSTALLVWAKNHGIRPDAILFADTGSEHPATLAYLRDVIGPWLARVGFPPVTTVRWVRVKGPLAGQFVALHEQCERLGELPSIAYGHSGCSDKWKRAPLDAAALLIPGVAEAHARGEVVERWVGYDADEHRRAARLANKPDPHLWQWRAPLHEARIDRDDALDLIRSEGLAVPRKSACWLCPHTRREEVYRLRAEHPDLYQRALAIEAGADLSAINGLGRSWSWRDIDRQEQLFEFADMPCGCADLRVARVRPHRRSRPYAARPARLDPWRSVLGLWPAARVAREAGVSVATVRKMAARSAGSGARSLL